MKIRIHTQQLDANESTFFARQLEYIYPKAYEVVYPEFSALQLIPVSMAANPGAEKITYRMYDSVGLAKIISNYGDDAPRSDIKATEHTITVRGIAGSFGYSLQEIRSARWAGVNLDQAKANAARKANDQLVNQIAWFGDAEHDIQGLLHHPNVTKTAAVTGDWLNAGTSADEIIADVNDAISDMLDITKGVERPNTVLLPVKMYAHIASTPRSATSDTTILAFLKSVWQGIEFISVPELAAVNPRPSTGAAVASNCMVIYNRNPDKLSLEIPQPYEMLPPQERGFEQVTLTHSRCAGMKVVFPLSISIVDGL